MKIENKCMGSNEFTWYGTEGCTFVATPTEDGKVLIKLTCRGEKCVHKEVEIVIGFDEYSSIGSRRMWSDELKETAFGRRNE